ncbi:C-type lectin domain family 2 member B-like [Lithobates pipiens]
MVNVLKWGDALIQTYIDPKRVTTEQGIRQKVTVLLLSALVGLLAIVVIILVALLSQRGKTSEEKAVVQCMDDWILYRGKCYYMSHKIDTWNKSQNFCKSHNSSLAIINDEKEMSFLHLLKCNPPYWIGLSRTHNNSGWVWTDGTFHSETTFQILKKPTHHLESQHVFLNSDGFKSESGRYLKKWICSKRL